VLFFDGALGLLAVGVWIFCIIDVITTPEGDCRNLPKMAWLFIVLLFFDIGSIVWLVAGRNWNREAANMPYKGNFGRPAAPRGRAGNPDDDEDYQAQLRARIDEQRRRARDAQPGDERPPTA
jgi:Phospholipase_D-nuclease N-terminal